MRKLIKQIFCFHNFTPMTFGMNFKNPDQRVVVAIFEKYTKCGKERNHKKTA